MRNEKTRNQKRDIRKEEIITREYNLLFLISKLFICQRNNNGFVYQNLLKQLPFYEKTIKPRIKKFANAKLLSE